MTKLQQLHEDIYSFLMDYHQKNPSFYFAPRTRSITNGKTLDEGFWFNGNDDYLSIGLYAPNDDFSKTRTIGFSLGFKNGNIAEILLLVTFRSQTLSKYVPIYEGIIEKLGGENTFVKKGENKYLRFYENPSDWKKCLLYFLEHEKPLIDSYLIDNKVENEFFIRMDDFEKYIERIEDIRNPDKKPIKQLNVFENSKKFQPQITSLMPTNTYPLNQILYGPPGTGKTYSTVELAYKIIHDDTPSSYEEARNWYKTALANTEDRQVEFITFHQNYSYEDFVMGIKPQLSEDTLGFREHKGIFFEICNRALKNLLDSQKPIEVIKQEKGLEELFDDFKNEILEKINASPNGRLMLNNTVYTEYVFDDAFSYKGDNWDNHGRMKFSDILKIYNNTNATSRQDAKNTPDITRTAKEHMTYFLEMVKLFRAFTLTHKVEINDVQVVPLKNYVIIIDEINRANISRVFGELITLIEEDKRWGNEFETEVRLPDGVTKFTVPKNLYIIGTMNTADKSIALLDIALRRRFEFTALYPDSSKISSKYQTFFESLNEQIIAKKGIDFTIGHSYFMTKNGEELDFVKTMNKKVIPLLSEYFYNAKDNKIVVELVEKAITKAGFAHTFVPSAYQLLIQ